MATLDVADFHSEPGHFLAPNPNCATLVDGAAGAGGALVGGVGGGAGTNTADTATAVLNTAQNSPILLAFTVTGDEDHICVGHRTLPTPPLATTWWWR